MANGDEDSPIEAFDPFNAHWASRLAKDKDNQVAQISVTNQTLLTTNAKNPFATTPTDVIAKTFEVKL